MTIADSADVELYLGAAIEHASERDVLKLLVDHLAGTGNAPSRRTIECSRTYTAAALRP